MKLYNLKEPNEKVTFFEATENGMGKNNGLYMPEKLPSFSKLEMESLLKMPFKARSIEFLHTLLADEISKEDLTKIADKAFNFPIQLVKIENGCYILELFHGPTLAFKDFGARFMAQVLSFISDKKSGKENTIVTATSGDTGAAVANAFYNVDGVRVFVLYPKSGVSVLQEKMFATLSNNITAVAVDGDFDACQALVKQCFADSDLNQNLKINSANSINISRLLAQCLYYLEMLSKCKGFEVEYVSVPSGNFGNLTAGLFVKKMGFNIGKFIATTNSNDTVKRYMESGLWEVKETIKTMSNAMDVSNPSNWERVKNIGDNILVEVISEEETVESMKQLYKLGYIADPHTSVAWAGLKRCGNGVALSTAHPSKFKDTVDKVLNINIDLPKELLEVANKPILSKKIDSNFNELKKLLLK